MLSEMTKEWADAINSISVYVFLRRKKGYSIPSDLVEDYNAWLHWSGLSISSPKLTTWLLNFLKDMYYMPFDLLETSLTYDKINTNYLKEI